MLTAAAIVLIGLAQEAGEVKQWVQALKGEGRLDPGAAPVRDRLRHGWMLEGGVADADLRPFDRLTNGQARAVVPLLLDLYEDGTILSQDPTDHVRDYVCERAHEALVRISFRRFGGFEKLAGPMNDPFGLDLRKEHPGTVVGRAWRDWWKKNRDREVDDWRREAVDGLMKAVRNRKADANSAETAVKTIADLAPAMKIYLRPEDFQELVETARGTTSSGPLRLEAIAGIDDLGLPQAADAALTLAEDDAEEISCRTAALRRIALPRSSGFRLLALARRMSNASDGALAPPEAAWFVYDASCSTLGGMLKVRQATLLPTRAGRNKALDAFEAALGK